MTLSSSSLPHASRLHHSELGLSVRLLESQGRIVIVVTLRIAILCRALAKTEAREKSMGEGCAPLEVGSPLRKWWRCRPCIAKCRSWPLWYTQLHHGADRCVTQGCSWKCRCWILVLELFTKVIWGLEWSSSLKLNGVFIFLRRCGDVH